MSTQLVDPEEVRKIFQGLRKIQGNDRCIECQKKNTQWASINLGLFMCYDCSGKHRNFGPKLSLVKSLTLDGWQRKQITYMEHGGNQKFIDFMRKNGGMQGNQVTVDWMTSPAIQRYKADLKRVIDNIESKNASNHPQQQDNQQEQQKQQQQEQEQAQNEEEVKQEQQEEAEEKQDKFNNNLSTNSNKNVKTTNVVFASKKNGKAQNGKKVKAEKIEDFDWDSLTFDDGTNAKKPEQKHEMAPSTNETNDQNDGFESFSSNKKDSSNQDIFASNQSNFGASTYNNAKAQENLDKYKTKKNVTAISSSNFFEGNNETSNFDKQKYSQFTGNQAISSNMFFDRQGSNDNNNSNGNSERISEALNNAKEKASEFFSKWKTGWK